MKLLAYCSNCNNIFQSRVFGEVASSATVISVKESCPRCGEIAQTSDYINKTMFIANKAFNTTNDTETLQNLLKILQNGLKQKQDPSQIADQIQKLDHKFDELAKQLRETKREDKLWAVLVTLIIKFIGLFISSKN